MLLLSSPRRRAPAISCSLSGGGGSCRSHHRLRCFPMNHAASGGAGWLTCGHVGHSRVLGSTTERCTSVREIGRVAGRYDAHVTLPLYVLSGIGGDERLFDLQRAVRDVRSIKWIEPAHDRETLPQYAARLARELHIDEQFDLGGSSFGGMIALELARLLVPQHVFLFGSCRSALAATPPSFIRWASSAVFSWKGVAQLPMPIHHVHGERDRLIPVRRVSADRVIAGAGHLLTLTHADAVNAFIEERCPATQVAMRANTRSRIVGSFRCCTRRIAPGQTRCYRYSPVCRSPEPLALG